LLTLCARNALSLVTEVPQFLLSLLPSQAAAEGTEAPKLLVTQPRRIAAVSLAARVAAESGTHVGGRVGHSVRFDTNVGRHTRIVFATEGMVVRELLGDKLLRYVLKPSGRFKRGMRSCG
jgi:HrpA-like RNA helicase